MIDKYKQAFQEEAREIVLELESALLELNERREDSELVGRVFHALHTIKGSGAMFGFDILAAFTHHIENAFDQVRDGRLIASPDLISLFLSAVDQIKAMLDKSSGRGKADDAKSAHILEKVANSRERSKALPKKARTCNRNSAVCSRCSSGLANQFPSGPRFAAHRIEFAVAVP